MRDPRRRPKPHDNNICEVPLNLIHEVDRLRLRHRPYPEVELLAAQIEEHGQTTPLFVRPLEDGSYELISGYRRTAALRLLEKPTALVRIFDLDDEGAYDLAVSENQHRDALSEIERAEICLTLSDRGVDHKQIAAKMGWTSDRSVRRYIQLARETTAPLTEKLRKREISFNCAMVFINHGVHLPEDDQRKILDTVVLGKTTSEQLQKTLLTLDSEQADRKAPEKEPIRNLKNGGFVLRTVRLDAEHPSGIERGIDVLRAALRKARRLKKRAADTGVAPAPEAETAE